VAVNDYYRVTVDQTLHGQKVLNTFYYQETTSAGGGSSAALANRFAVVVIPTMKACQSNEVQHNGVYAQKIWPLPPIVPSFDASAAGPGGVPGSSLPSSMAVVMTKQTAFAGRKYRGRVYIAGLAAIHEDDSKLAPGVFNLWSAFSTTLAGVLAPAGYAFTPIVYHKATRTHDNIVNVLTRTNLRNQRRRQIGKGV